METCPHLEPLERELEAKGIALGEGGDSPYGPDWGVWYPCDCSFDGERLRSRLGLADCVDYTEYDGRVAGSDATFYCRECKRAIIGIHPRYAGAAVVRLR